MAEYDTETFTFLHENIEKIVLNNITSVSLNTDILRTNFEVIVSILKGLTRRMDQEQSNALLKSNDIKDLKDKLEKLEEKQKKDKEELNEKNINSERIIYQNSKEIEKLQHSLHDLKDNQNNISNTLQKCQSDVNNTKEKLEQHDKQIQEILSQFNQNSKGDNLNNSSMENLQKFLENMKGNYDNQISEIQKMLENFVKKDEFNNYKDQTGNRLQSHHDSIEDIYNQLKNTKSLISDKLNCDSFDEHLKDYNNIKNIVISLANNNGEQKNIIQSVVNSGPSLSTKDANILKELGQKFPELENLVKRLQKDLTDHLSNFKVFSEETTKRIQNDEENLRVFIAEMNKKLLEFLHSLQEATNESKQRFSSIEEELSDIRGLKAKIEMIEILLREKEKDQHKLRGSKTGSFENTLSNPGLTLDQVKQLIDEELKTLRDEIMAILEAFRNLIEKKVDSEDLLKSEAALLEKLDQIAGALMKRAQADKNDTKKALMFLEKKINEISLLVLGGPANSEEAAIFAKRPWTPWSCASCDTKLKDYPGPLIDHKNWNKLPLRETSPGRLSQGKFGKGWSKWVENKRNTVEKSRDSFILASNKVVENLPEIQPEGGRSQVDSSRNNE